MAYRHPPTASHRIGFEIETPTEVEVQPGDIVRCLERRDGNTIGELEVAVFHAALLIDRDGILAEKAQSEIERARVPGARVLPTIPVSLPGASGFRADLEVVHPMGAEQAPLPFVYVFAMASHNLALDGGLVVTVRCATPEWRAADEILSSLRLLSRRGQAPTSGSDEMHAVLPMIGRRED